MLTKLVDIFKPRVRLLIKMVCQIVFLRQSIRWLTRRLLHMPGLPKSLDRILMRLSAVIPVPDIECFEEQYGWIRNGEGQKIYIVTKPSINPAVATTFWRGLGYIDAETVAVFCERARLADTILDIGANWGYYTLLAGAINPNAKIVAFEPNPFWFEQLKKNIRANRFKSVSFENFAVSDNSGVSTFYLDNNSPGASSMVGRYVRDVKSREIKINTISLDDYFKEEFFLNKYRIDLIKLDVELYESTVLAGSQAILQKYRPDIICEVLPDETHTIDLRIANREAIQDILCQFGYISYWISNQGLVKEDVIQGHYPLSNYLFTTCLAP